MDEREFDKVYLGRKETRYFKPHLSVNRVNTFGERAILKYLSDTPIVKILEIYMKWVCKSFKSISNHVMTNVNYQAMA